MTIFWFHELMPRNKRGRSMISTRQLMDKVRNWFDSRGYDETDYTISGDGMRIHDYSVAILFKMTWNDD